MKTEAFRKGASILLLAAITLGGAAVAGEDKGAGDGPKNIKDPYIKAWDALTYDKKPPRPVPGVDYGIDPQTGKFVAPKSTPMVNDAPNFPGQLDYWDQKSYAKNMEVIAFYPQLASPHHSWQNIVDFGKHRYMYVYDRGTLRIFDITDPRKGKLLLTKGPTWGPNGKIPAKDPFEAGDYFGAASIMWNKDLKKYIMVQSFEVSRQGVMSDKAREPENVDKVRHWPSHKGFKVYAMNGPLPDQWERLAVVTTDIKHPDAKPGEQQGSGSLDVPAYYGGKYMFLSTAPDDSYALTEYPDYLYSPGYQAWDMSDPSHPKLVSQITVPGQVVGDKASEDAYLMNPRAGNRTSWMGSRMPLFLPKPVEKGGKIAFGGMAGLGFYSFDVSDPANVKVLGHLNTVPKFAGTEFDNVDVSQYERTGYVFSNGYPMNDECFEPNKDIFVIDAKDPANPKIVGSLPRPVAPEGAAFTDFCQRRGSFGPKRPGYHTQPGVSRDGIVTYAYYNAGIQMFDVKDPTNPKIVAYYVPRFPKKDEMPEHVFGNLTYGTYIEYDRNIVWAFTNHGIYALSSTALGKPVYGMPKKSWPPRD